MVAETKEGVYVTEVGVAALQAEIACLRELQREVSDERRCPAYTVEWQLQGVRTSAAELSAIEREIRQIERVLQNAVPVGANEGRVGVGSRVWLCKPDGRRRAVGLVGPMAANSLLGLVSYESSLGKALLGKQLGDTVEVLDNGDVRRERIVEVGTLVD